MGNLAQGEHYKPTAENIRNVERLERGIGAPTEGKDLLQAQILDVLKSLRDGQNASNEHLSALKNHAETQPHKRTLSNPGKDE
jgi:hypothetical protein